MQYDENAEKYGYEGEMTPMKCDELTEYTSPTYGSAYYDIDEVDAAIAELKEAWRSEHEACEALKAKLEDAGMREHRLRRALWLMRLQSLRNFSVLAYFQMIRAKGKKSNMDFNEMAYRIDLARVKCRAKAEEY